MTMMVVLVVFVVSRVCVWFLCCCCLTLNTSILKGDCRRIYANQSDDDDDGQRKEREIEAKSEWHSMLLFWFTEEKKLFSHSESLVNNFPNNTCYIYVYISREFEAPKNPIGTTGGDLEINVDMTSFEKQY